MEKFDVLKVRLNACNLIEASAGTGKTYSIGILLLRIILEKPEIAINQILMVTFTDAAVEELRGRIRSFIRDAYAKAQDPDLLVDGDHISLLVQTALERDPVQSYHRLKDALALIDELAIYTIHSFCGRTLGEFAFETKQLFEKEMLIDPSVMLDKSIRTFWRNEISVLPVEELTYLIDDGFSMDLLREVVKNILDGKRLLLTEIDLTTWRWDYQQLEAEQEAIKQEFIAYYEKDPKGIQDELFSIKGKGAFNGLKNSFHDSSALFELFLEKLTLPKPPAYLRNMQPTWQDIFDRFGEKKKQKSLFITNIKANYCFKGAEFVKEDFKKRKDEFSLQTFNDLIYDLHDVITSDKKANLVTGLREKYKAVFIDEFQDTDRVQYEIFYEAFRRDSSESVLFYIGDPKQSIYSFRQADLETYKRSREGSEVFTMTTNFRSTDEYVETMNSFFRSSTSFFADEEIQYIDVESSPTASNLGHIQNATSSSIDFIEARSPELYPKAVSKIILDLLKQGEINEQKIKPSQIGVLVSMKSDGQIIKNALNEIGVPAVLLDDTKVIDTDEAKYLQYILEAVVQPVKNRIQKALLTPIFSTTFQEVQHLDIAIEQQRFQECAKAFEGSGVFGVLNALLSTYHVQGVLLVEQPTKVHRMLSNLFQLAEICQKKIFQHHFDLEKLIDWLIRERQDSQNSNEGYELRIENDEQAVNIVTIHKSKGLAYDVVITPSLQMHSNPHAKSSTLTFQDEESLDYVFSFDKKNEEYLALFKTQKEKENRRLIYVALTRAKYKSYVILKEKITTAKNYFIDQLLPVLKETNTGCFSFSEYTDEPLGFYKSEKIKTDKSIEKVENLKDFYNSWHLLSYSSISKSHERFVPTLKEEEQEGFDAFVFGRLTKGASMGNYLHYLFENIDFQEEESFLPIIDKGQYLFGKHLVNDENKDYFSDLIHHVLKSRLISSHGEFSLENIPKNKRLNELQFYFEISSFSKIQLEKFDQEVDMDFSQYTGFFQGFIDLVIEQDGVYYILDWKSNYLGDHIGAYDKESLQEAMTHNNYHLQYFIYTIALIRFLKKRLPDFDYEKQFGGCYYLFLRGCREEKNSGVFYHKPNWDAVNQFLG